MELPQQQISAKQQGRLDDFFFIPELRGVRRARSIR